MNNQLLIRTLDFKEFEVLHYESTFFDIKKYNRKVVSINTLLNILNSYVHKTSGKTIIHHYNQFENDVDDIVAYTKTTKDETYIINLKEQYIRTFYNGKYYKIIHPNCFVKITVINKMVNSMSIYPYKEFQGLETVLYDNPYPNIYSNNETCMGSADRTLLDSVTRTVLTIIETSYTHSNTGFNSKNLKDTARAFRYLSKKAFPYEKLMTSNKTLKLIIDDIK